jgi:hypothetical protein
LFSASAMERQECRPLAYMRKIRRTTAASSG